MLPPDAISIVIPTYRREQVLLDTLDALLRQEPAAAEILVVDQTEGHEPDTTARLAAWDAAGLLRWLRLERPSVTAAMNAGLLAARCPLVLFLDDDIIPGPGLVAAHARNYQDPAVVGVVGQILQPGQSPAEPPARLPLPGIWRDLDFPFNSTQAAEIDNGMAGNLSVRREVALQAGGFDENFRGVAYRFETEFARRLRRVSGGKVRFDPAASLRHLQAARGGTRAYGIPLCSASPAHSVGEYYLAFREGRGWERVSFILWRMFRSVRTRFHLARPWCIPIKLTGEVRGLAWAARLHWRGPALLPSLPPEAAPPHE
ncbi:MAG: glycosyltransferase [Akkermansiaceae bacterium]|nr:glycosyltransferase [Akkermansiaceae bacterium]